MGNNKVRVGGGDRVCDNEWCMGSRGGGAAKVVGHFGWSLTDRALDGSSSTEPPEQRVQLVTERVRLVSGSVRLESGRMRLV